MHFFPAPVSAVFRLNNRLVEKMSKVVRVLISPQDNIAAASAVTPIRSPFGNEFFAPETDTPPSALSGLRKNFDAIDKHDVRHCHREPPCHPCRRHLSASRTQGARISRRRRPPSRFNQWVSGLDAFTPATSDSRSVEFGCYSTSCLSLAPLVTPNNYERSPAGSAHQMGFGNDEGTRGGGETRREV